MPGQWAKEFDAGSKAYYYYNVETYETTWEKPADFQEEGGESLTVSEGMVMLKAVKRIQRGYRAKVARGVLRSKRAERKADKNPIRVVKTAMFKDAPVRRSTSSLPAFEVRGSAGLCESSPLQGLESTLQGLSVGERRDEGGAGANSLDSAGTAPAKQGKSVRRRSNAAVNAMADDFSCFQLRDQEPQP